MSENYDFADLSGRYYARELEFEKSKKNFLKLIKQLLVDINSNIRNPPIDMKTYMCPVHHNLWDKDYKKRRITPPDYIWDRVCPDCFDKFCKMDALKMLNIFPGYKSILEKLN